MTQTLRTRLIEAGARRIAAAHADGIRYEQSEPYREHAHEDMAIALDAFLDAFEENADSLVAVQRKGHRSKRRVSDIYADELIAVLRGDTDGAP